MKSILIKDTTREERIRIVHQALWGACGIDCEFCSGCDNRGGGRIESIYQPYIDGVKEIREINAEYNAPFMREYLGKSRMKKEGFHNEEKPDCFDSYRFFYAYGVRSG